MVAGIEKIKNNETKARAMCVEKGLPILAISYLAFKTELFSSPIIRWP